jgi:toxin YoeB
VKYKITIKKEAQQDIEYFAKHDRAIFKKIRDLIDELENHPFFGRGKPEPLKFELSSCWSRRITLEHRLVYKVEKQEVTIIGCRHHYSNSH